MLLQELPSGNKRIWRHLLPLQDAMSYKPLETLLIPLIDQSSTLQSFVDQVISTKVDASRGPRSTHSRSSWLWGEYLGSHLPPPGPRFGSKFGTWPGAPGAPSWPGGWDLPRCPGFVRSRRRHPVTSVTCQVSCLVVSNGSSWCWERTHFYTPKLGEQGQSALSVCPPNWRCQKRDDQIPSAGNTVIRDELIEKQTRPSWIWWISQAPW